VWDEHWFGSTKTLDVHVAALRRRLAEAGGDAVVPETVLDALEAKGRAALFRANLRDFLLREHRLNAT
jgi:hypothetical protein